VSLNQRIRFGVRVGAGCFGVTAAGYGGYAVRHGHTDDAFIMRGLTLVLIITGIWVITEAIVGGFEEIGRRTQERYDRLEQLQPNAYAIAGQAVCETLRIMHEQAAEESENVRVLHR